MLSLLSRIVIGSEPEENHVSDRSPRSSYDSSSGPEDTDEEYLNPPMPVINIDQTELAEEALDAQRALSCKGEHSDSMEDVSNDSAIEKESLPPPVLPSKDVCHRILELVEYYLSDENLVKDMFLLKHVTKHREGYVSLKLLASYKKVKRLTKDWRVVAHALKASSTLEMNPEETKTRRLTGLPQELEEDTRPFRTIIATHIPKELANMNNLAEYFAKFGEMVSLQVHKPGGRALDEIRQVDRAHPGSSNTICAIVVYEKVHCARQALRLISNSSKCGMKAVEIPRKKREMGSLLGINPQMDNESCYFSASDVSEPASPVYRARHIRLMSPSSSIASSPSVSPIPKRRYWASSLSPESSPPSPRYNRRGPPTPLSSPEEHRPARSILSCDSFPPRYEVPGSLPLPRRQLPPRKTPSPDSSTWRRGANISNASSTDMPVLPLSPWLRRRVLAKTTEGYSASAVSSPSASPSLRRRNDSPMPLPDNVERMPRGPDGTRGFNNSRPMVNAQA